MYKYISLYVLAIIGIFIEPAILGSLGNLVLKLTVIAAISYVLYDLWKSQTTVVSANPEPEQINEPVTVVEKKPDPFFEINPSPLTELLKNDRQYFDFLNGQFSIVWNFILPHNGYLFYCNSRDERLLLHNKNRSDINWLPNDDVSILFTLIENKDGVLIENNIEPAINLLPFYKSDQFKARSLMAFTTEFSDKSKLFWIFDADSSDFFNVEDVLTLEQINKNTRTVLQDALKFSGLSESYSVNQRKLDIALRVNSARTMEHCIEIFSDFLIGEFEASKMTIATRKYDNGNNNSAIISKAIGIDDPFKTGYEFALDEGINGWVILKNKPYMLDNIDKGEYFVPRFSRTEKSNYEIRSFLSVPLQGNSEALGMITLEDKSENKYTLEDKHLLLEYSKILSAAMWRFINQKTSEDING